MRKLKAVRCPHCGASDVRERGTETEGRKTLRLFTCNECGDDYREDDRSVMNAPKGGWK